MLTLNIDRQALLNHQVLLRQAEADHLARQVARADHLERGRRYSSRPSRGSKPLGRAPFVVSLRRTLGKESSHVLTA